MWYRRSLFSLPASAAGEQQRVLGRFGAAASVHVGWGRGDQQFPPVGLHRRCRCQRRGRAGGILALLSNILVIAGSLVAPEVPVPTAAHRPPGLWATENWCSVKCVLQ